MYKFIPVVVLAFFPAGHCAADRFTELLAKVPESANALVMVDVTAAFASPVAQRENWAQRQIATHAGMMAVSPSMDMIVIGTQFDLATLRPGWQVGLTRLKDLFPMSDLARAEGGTPDTVAGIPVVLSPRNAYFAALKDKEIAIGYPANRQALGRWLRKAKDKTTVTLPPYLQEAATANAAGPLVIAVDCADAIDPAMAKAYLPYMKSLAGKPFNLNQLAAFTAGLRGLTFTAAIGESVTGKLQVDFTTGVRTHSAYLKPLLLEVLDSQGALVEEFRDWQAKFTDTAMTLEGPITAPGLKRLLSLFELPTFHPQGEGSEVANPVASKRYFRAVSELLDELKRMNKPADYNKNALWHDTYAKKIDQLPVLGVDPDLLKYGAATAGRLRAIAGSLRGVPIQTAALEASKEYTYWNDPGFFRGGTWVKTNYAEVNAKQAQVAADDAQMRDKVWAKIAEDTAAVRQTMTVKYKTEF